MANITRIKNNQITDSTIEYTKIKPGTLVGSVFNANITLNSNVTIVGNLSVSGETSTVQSTNTYINDPLVIFNNGYTSAPSFDIGILVNRNLTATAPYGSVNAALVWQEAAKGFAAVMTTETGTTQGAINNSGYANVFVGNTFANTVSIRDTVSSTNSTTGALVVAGGVGIGGALNVAGEFGVTGNLTTTAGGLISGATTGYLFNETATTINMGAAATTINVGNTSGTTNLKGILKTSGNIVAQSTTDSVDLASGAVVIAGGLAVAKNITASSAVITTGLVTNFSTANAVITGGSINSTPIGGATPDSGDFTTITSTGTMIASGNIVAASGTASTNDTTGALVVEGGVGVSGNINVHGTYSIITGNVGIGPDIIPSEMDGPFVVSLNARHEGGLGAIAHFVGKDGNAVRILQDAFTNNADEGPNFLGRRARGTGVSPTATQAGDRLVIVGGRGHNGTNFSANTKGYMAVYAAETQTETATGTYIDFGVTPIGSNVVADAMTIASSGNILIHTATDSISTATGSLVTLGGVGIAGNLNVGGNFVLAGNLTVQGNTSTIGSDDLTVNDSIINLHTQANLAPWTTDDGRDIGVKFHYYKGVDNHAFLGWANDTGYLEYYAAGSEVANVFVGTDYGTIKAGAFTAVNTTPATSTTTGALTISGGAGIAGNLYIGGLIHAGTAEFASINNTPIGNATPSTGAFTTLSSTLTMIAGGNVVANSGTASTSTTTGALVVVGGIGASGDVHTGGTLTTTGVITAGGNVVANSGTASTSTTTGALVVNGGVGVSGAVITGGNIVAGSGTASSSTTTGALVVVGGTGISGNATIGNDIVVAGDAYIAGGDILTSATTFNLLNTTATTVNAFGAATTLNTGNASGTTNMAGVVKVGGNIVAQSTTDSTSTTTGSIVAFGGIGIAGNVTAGNAAVFNSSQTAGMDFVIKGDTDTTLFWAMPNATYDQVIIGGSLPSANVVPGAKLHIDSTDSLLLPTGTTAERPSNAGFADVQGMLRYNKTLGYIEFYTGTQWNGVSTQFTVITDEQFNGDGSTVAFTLGAEVTTNATIVSINGVIQIPTLAYSVSGTTLTFTEAPATGDIIDVRRLTTTQTVTAIASSNGYMQFLADNDGAYITTGTSSVNPTAHWDTSGAQVGTLANIAVSSANTATAIDSFDKATYRSAKYVVQVTSGADYQVSEVLVIHNGTTATRTMYGTIDTNGNLGVTAATINGSNVELQYIAANANTTVRITKDYLLI